MFKTPVTGQDNGHAITDLLRVCQAVSSQDDNPLSRVLGVQLVLQCRIQVAFQLEQDPGPMQSQFPALEAASLIAS